MIYILFINLINYYFSSFINYLDFKNILNPNEIIGSSLIYINWFYARIIFNFEKCKKKNGKHL